MNNYLIINLITILYKDSVKIYDIIYSTSLYCLWNKLSLVYTVYSHSYKMQDELFDVQYNKRPFFSQVNILNSFVVKALLLGINKESGNKISGYFLLAIRK